MLITVYNRKINIEITHYYKGLPAKIFALPENCYPAEPPELEFEIAEDESDYDFLQQLLEDCESFYKKCEKQIYEEM